MLQGDASLCGGVHASRVHAPRGPCGRGGGINGHAYCLHGALLDSAYQLVAVFAVAVPGIGLYEAIRVEECPGGIGESTPCLMAVIQGGYTPEDSRPRIHPRCADAHSARHTSDPLCKRRGVLCRWSRFCLPCRNVCMFRRHGLGNVFRRSGEHAGSTSRIGCKEKASSSDVGKKAVAVSCCGFLPCDAIRLRLPRCRSGVFLWTGQACRPCQGWMCRSWP